MPASELIKRLREKNDELISFYVSETKAIITDDIIKKLKEIRIDIIDNPIYGWFDTYTIYDFKDEIQKLIEEIETLITNIRGILVCLSNRQDDKRGKYNIGIEFLLSILDSLKSILGMLRNIDLQDHNGDNSPIISNKILEEIKNILKKIEDLENQLKDIPTNIKDLIEKIKRMLQPISVKPMGDVLGVFYPRDFKIELSRNNINDWISQSIDFEKKLLNVYSHELFHAFHFLYVTSISYWRKIQSIVKESLARYIEFRYCMKFIGVPEIICDHMESWNSNDMFDFPYSGAKYLNRVENLCESIFKSSLLNKKSAFLMIDSFYEKEEKTIDCSVCNTLSEKVLKIVTRYISDHQEIRTFVDIQAVFPKMPAWGKVLEESYNITPAERGEVISPTTGKPTQKRYLFDDPVLPDVYVSNQWQEIEVKQLAQYVKLKLGYKVRL